MSPSYSIFYLYLLLKIQVAHFLEDDMEIRKSFPPSTLSWVFNMPNYFARHFQKNLSHNSLNSYLMTVNSKQLPLIALWFHTVNSGVGCAVTCSCIVSNSTLGSWTRMGCRCKTNWFANAVNCYSRILKQILRFNRYTWGSMGVPVNIRFWNKSFGSACTEVSHCNKSVLGIVMR